MLCRLEDTLKNKRKRGEEWKEKAPVTIKAVAMSLKTSLTQLMSCTCSSLLGLLIHPLFHPPRPLKSTSSINLAQVSKPRAVPPRPVALSQTSPLLLYLKTYDQTIVGPTKVYLPGSHWNAIILFWHLDKAKSTWTQTSWPVGLGTWLCELLFKSHTPLIQTPWCAPTVHDRLECLWIDRPFTITFSQSSQAHRSTTKPFRGLVFCMLEHI